MINHFHWIVMDGKPSKDFDVYTSGAGTYLSPERSFEEVEVPGRNGSIYLYDGNYKNVDISYDAWIAKADAPKEIDRKFRSLRSFLLSRDGYFRLEDTYHPDEIRFASYNEAFDPDVHESLEIIKFTLVFSCKPQRFIKNFYDLPIEITSSGFIFNNDTYLIAKPLLRVYGTGTFAIGNVSVTINSANTYTDIDCDLQEAYKDTLATNCNGKITLTNAQFPYIVPGENTITFSGISKIELYPRLYHL